MNIGIIGAGIGGLVSAALLASKGHSVKVFEKNDTPGGKLNQIVLDSYRFDTGPSLFTMPFVLESIFQECGESLPDYLTYSSLEPLCRYTFADGTRFDNFADISKTLDSIQRFAPEDAENYVSFLGKSADLYKRTAQAFLFNPLTDWSDFKQLPFFDLLKIDAFSTVSESVNRSIQSEYLRLFFKRFATYNGSSPYKAPATLNVIPYVELAQGGYYIHGGMYALAQALEKLAIKKGAEILYNSPVEEIIIKNKKVKGVKTSERLFTSDCVISNADSILTYTKLLPDSIIPLQQKKRFKQVEPSTSGFVLLLGINKTYRELRHHNIFFSDQYEREFYELFSEKKPSKNPTIYIANTSFAEKGHAPEGHSNLFILVNAPFTHQNLNWEKRKSEYAERIIQKLREHGLFDLDKHIQVQHCITPDDFEQIHGANRGSIYGISSNSRYAAFFRPRNRSPYVKGLYLVGGGTHPGGGIPLVSLSAKHAVTLIERDFRNV